jgi:hypothetical protein
MSPMTVGGCGRGAMVPQLQSEPVHPLLLGGFEPADGLFKVGDAAGNFQDGVNRGLGLNGCGPHHR